MNTIQTVTGKEIDFVEPEISQIDIEDIAHALSMKCRFNGHVSHFYSVGLHSLLVYDLAKIILREMSNEIPLNKQIDIEKKALMHDFSEAYISDIHSPLKRMLPAYQHIELLTTQRIDSAFNVSYNPYTEYVVDAADKIMLIIENDHLLENDLSPEVYQRIPSKFLYLRHNEYMEYQMNYVKNNGERCIDTKRELIKKFREYEEQ